MKRTLLLALVAGISFAQTASIYELSGDDAAEGLKLHDAMVKADADYAKWTEKMSRRYGKDYGVSGVGADLHEPLDFSPDFKHAVPKSNPVQSLVCGVTSPAAAGLVCTQ